MAHARSAQGSYTDKAGGPLMHLKDSLNPRVQGRLWRYQRLVWLIVALFLAAAAVGVFGTGPVASTTVVNEDGSGRIELEHSSFNRRLHPDPIHIRVDAPATGGDMLRVAFSPSITDRVSIRSSVPPSNASALGPTGATYVFQVEDWSAPLTVTLELVVEDWGRLSGHVTVTPGEGEARVLPLRQVVYP